MYSKSHLNKVPLATGIAALSTATEIKQKNIDLSLFGRSILTKAQRARRKRSNHTKTASRRQNRK